MATKVKNLTLGTEVLTDTDYTILSGMVNQAMTTAGSKIASVTAGNNGVTVTTDGSKNAVVYAKVSEKNGNHLSIESGTGEKGLYVPWPTAADLGLGSAYVPKGSITVAAANTDDSTSSPASTWSEGWVYNLSDDGTINNGLGGTAIVVKAGDNIVRVKDTNSQYRWDKLSATISVPVTNIAKTDPITVSSSNGTFTVGLNTGSGLAVPTSGTDSGKLTAKVDGTTIVKDGNGALKCDLHGGPDGTVTVTSSLIMVNDGAGLVATGNDLSVSTGPGITIDESGTDADKVRVNNGNGLDFSSGSLVVKGGKGISVDSGGVNVDPDPAKGLAFTGAGAAQQLAVNAGNGLEFGATSGQADYGQLKAKAYNGIEVTSNGVGVKANVTDNNKKNISANANGAYVDLGRALVAAGKASVSGGYTYIDESGTTIGDVIVALNGGTFPVSGE